MHLPVKIPLFVAGAAGVVLVPTSHATIPNFGGKLFYGSVALGRSTPGKSDYRTSGFQVFGIPGRTVSKTRPVVRQQEDRAITF
jgi:hypothetical protein